MIKLKQWNGIWTYNFKKIDNFFFVTVSGHTEVVDYLLDKGASVDCKEGMKETPLHCAAGKH